MCSVRRHLEPHQIPERGHDLDADAARRVESLPRRIADIVHEGSIIDESDPIHREIEFADLRNGKNLRSDEARAILESGDDLDRAPEIVIREAANIPDAAEAHLKIGREVPLADISVDAEDKRAILSRRNIEIIGQSIEDIALLRSRHGGEPSQPNPVEHPVERGYMNIPAVVFELGAGGDVVLEIESAGVIAVFVGEGEPRFPPLEGDIRFDPELFHWLPSAYLTSRRCRNRPAAGH